MSNSNLLLIGSGGHTKSCIDVIENSKRFKIVGLIGLQHEIKNKVGNYEVIGVDSDLKILSKTIKYALITIGQIKTFKKKMDLFIKAKNHGYELPTIISPFAYVASDVLIGEGTIIMHGVIINSGSKIGKNCIINTRSLIEHEVDIEDHCHVSTGTILNGQVKVKSKSFIGSGAIIRENIIIEEESFIGMGKIISKNFKNNE